MDKFIGLESYLLKSTENKIELSFSKIEQIIARNGSVGSVLYHNNPYCSSSDDIRVLTSNFGMNKCSALFIKTILEQEKFKYAYGRKLGTSRIKKW